VLGFVEEIVLLQLDDTRGKLIDLPASAEEVVIVGAALMELALLNRIDSDPDRLMLVDSRPTGDDILDDVLTRLASVAALSSTSAIEHLSHQADTYQERALRRLIAKKILREDNGRFLWVFQTRRYPLIDDAETREVKTRLRQVLLTDELPDPRDIVLICLIEACDMLRLILTPDELAAAGERVAQLSRLDLIGQAVTKAVGEIHFIVKNAAAPTY
jgi:hypothetical protein